MYKSSSEVLLYSKGKIYCYWCSSISEVLLYGKGKIYHYRCSSTCKRAPLNCCYMVKARYTTTGALQPVKELLFLNISEKRRVDLLNIHEPSSSALFLTTIEPSPLCAGPQLQLPVFLHLLLVICVHM